MFKRQTTGSVVCASCGYLVGVKDDRCYHCGRRNPGLFGFSIALRNLGHDAGFVPFVTGFCILMYLISMLLGGFSLRPDLSFLSPGDRGLFLLGASGTGPVVGLHRWWTIFSASWLHGSLLHIFFNLMWIRQLAPGVAEFYGPGRMVIVYVLGGAVGFLVSSGAGLVLSSLPPPLGAANIVVGASSSIFALLGALVYYGNRAGSRHVHAQALSWALSAFVIGLLIPYVDNYAHAGGFLGGYLVGRILDPLKQEQINHIVMAVVLLLVSVLSVVASVIHGFYLLSLAS